MAKTELFVRRQAGGMFTVVNETMTTGNIFFVHSGTGTNSTSYGRSPDSPVATIDYAIGLCTANQGDRIFVMPGHAETIATAGGITADIAGVTITGLGVGSTRPVITFGSLTSASVLISAASVTIKNIVAVCNIDGATNPFHVQAADCTLDIEFRDTSSTVEAARAILTTSGADRLRINLKYQGFIAGNAVVNAIRLVGVDTAEIDVDFYGIASTAVVEFHTTLCSNIVVRGNFYVSGTTDLSKNVVDTVGTSLWSVEGFDAAAAKGFSGGSAAAVASDDVSGVAADTANILAQLSGAAGIASWSAGAPPGNAVSLAEALRDLWDGVRNGTGGSEPGANKSIIDALGFDGVAAVAASAGMIRTMTGTTFVVSKTVVASAIVAAGVDLTAVSSGGAILIEDVVIQNAGTQMDSGGNAAVLELHTDNVAGAGSFITDAEAKLIANVVLSGATHTTNNKVVLETGKKIIAKATTEDFTSAGNVTFHIICRRLADNATLVAA